MEKDEKTNLKGGVFWRRLGGVLGFILLFNFFLFHRIGGAGIVVFLFGVLGLVLTNTGVKRFDRVGFLFGLLAGVFGLLLVSILYRSYPLVTFVDFWAGVVFLGGLAYFLLSGEGFWRSPEALLRAKLTILNEYVSRVFYILAGIFSGKPEDLLPESLQIRPITKIRSLLVGLVMGLGVAMVILGLLVVADPIFGHFVRSFSWPKNTIEWVFRALVSGFLLAVLCPTIYFRTFSRGENGNIRGWWPRLSIASEVSVALVVVVGLFTTYLAISWPYVFASVAKETSLVSLGVSTYSEYVRRGFGEFLLVAVIFYFLTAVGVAIKKLDMGQSRFLSWVIPVALAEFFIYLASMFRRISLYQQFHGWSLVRIYGGVFLAWVLGMGVILVWRYVSAKKLPVWELGFTVVVVLFVSFFNAEDFIVRFDPPTVNGRVDYVYLSKMSADGFEGWRESFEWASGVLTRPRNGEIGQDERRNVAYAGRVISNLIGKHEELTQLYADTNKKTDFYRAIRIDYYGKEATVLPGEQVQPIGIGIPPSDFPAPGQYYPCCFLYSPFEKGPGVRGVFQESWWDLFLSQNMGERGVYGRMVKEIPLVELLKLQRGYFDLVIRIDQQPAGERSYSEDVSFRTPLLGD